jgi:hypothetical protein
VRGRVVRGELVALDKGEESRVLSKLDVIIGTGLLKVSLEIT